MASNNERNALPGPGVHHPPQFLTQFTQFWSAGPKGDIISIFLEAHTPGLPYDLKFSDGSANTIWLGRTGLTDATGVVMSDALDNRVTFAAASDGGQHNAGLVTWHIGSLPISQTITRTVAVTIGNVISGTILSHTLLVTSIEGISDTRIITTTVLSSSTSSSNRFIYLPTILKN
jgi:hypothetical protein